MRYLKSFNEGTSFLPEDLNELQYFCETYLAYLIDEGFGIRVRHGSRKDRVRIEFYKGEIHFPIAFSWDDVKDHIIPFLHMLIREYSIEPMRLIDQSKLTYQTKNTYIDDNPRNRTIQFNRYLPDTYSNDLYYMDIRNVIKDEGVPEQFYQLQLQFY